MLKNNILYFLIGILSGILTSLSFPIIYGYSIFMPISLIPLFYVINKNNSIKTMFITSLGYSLAINCMVFFWIPLSLSEMWKFPLWISFMLFLPLALFSEFNIFITLWFRKKIFNNNPTILKIFIIGMIFSGFEYLFANLFPDNLGFCYYNNIYLAQAFDISGGSILSFLYWITNEIGYHGYTTKNYKKEFATLSIIYLLFFSYGFFRLNEFNKAKTKANKISGLMIQPNFHHNERNSARTGDKFLADKILNRHYDLSLKGYIEHPNTNFIIWPETTYPFYYKNSASAYEDEKEIALDNFLKDKNITLFFGAFGKTSTTPIIIKNNLYSITHLSNNIDTNRWEKTILFPFGEYIPGVKTFPWLKKIFPKANTPQPSEKPMVLPVKYSSSNKSINIGASICYEVLFSKLFRNQALDKSDLIINISNESYFGYFGEPQLNLMHTGIRAIESRLPVLKSGNTGFSGAINSSGEIISQSKMNEQTYIYATIPLINSSNYILPLYVLFGDWFAYLSIILIFGYLVNFIIFRK